MTKQKVTDLFDIEEINILIQSVEDWLSAERNQDIMRMIGMHNLSFLTQPNLSEEEVKENIKKINEKINVDQIKFQDRHNEKRDKVILIQGKLVKLKRKIWEEMQKKFEGNAFPKSKEGK